MKNKTRLILVTNDDGISAKGIRVLIEAAKKFGKVVTVAPDSPQSAKSHSISSVNPVSYKKIIETENYSEYSCSGTPVDCVKIAIHKILPQKPDLLLSGVNHGSNTSMSVLYSGTMAAAVEGAMNKIQSVGFSVDSLSSESDFTSALPFIEKIINELINNTLPEGITLNVNIPDPQKQSIKGIAAARGAEGFWKEDFISANCPYSKDKYWLSGEFINFEPDAKDTDEYLLKNGYISVVPIKFDFNAYEFIDKLQNWNFTLENGEADYSNQ